MLLKTQTIIVLLLFLVIASSFSKKQYAKDWVYEITGFSMQGKHEEVIEYYDIALETDPNDETINNQPTTNILKNYDTLQICIKLKPYKGKRFLHEDGKIYTDIKDLSKALNFEYSYDKENKILTINGDQYNYEYLLKNEKILYVGLTTCCLFLGYKVDYNQITNILDISISGVTTSIAQDTKSSASVENTIEPGVSVGRIYIGMNIDSVKQIWGKPTLEKSRKDITVVYYETYGFMFLCDFSSRQIVMILTRNPSYHVTRNNITIGTSSDEVKKYYNCEIKGNTWDYPGKCIAFHFTEKGNVESIAIYNPNFLNKIKKQKELK